MMNTVIPEFAPANIRDPANMRDGPGSRLFVLTHYGRDDNVS
jgi:hypothetical protein